MRLKYRKKKVIFLNFLICNSSISDSQIKKIAYPYGHTSQARDESELIVFGEALRTLGPCHYDKNCHLFITMTWLRRPWLGWYGNPVYAKMRN